MPFCAKCGTKLEETVKFCPACGTKRDLPIPAAAPVPAGLPMISGKEVRLPLWNEQILVPAPMDAFNSYRKQFALLARKQAMALRAEYCARVTNLDAFLTVFPEIYQKHRRPLIDAAMDILCNLGIYDISPEQFEDQHTADFCLCGEDVDTIIESFNLTIEANQDKKIRMYNLMPGMVFHGLGGFAAALAVNVAVNKIAEADIKNANVTPKQRQELFQRVNPELLMERAYIDYWRVFLSLTYRLNQRNLGVWYPNEQDNSRAEGLFQNLLSGRIPQDRILSQIVILFSLNPYNDSYIQYLSQCFGTTAEVQAITNYFRV